ncbi:MAG: CinA family nicotinamide mononucleotide deamidase-related protein, partial [Dehalococcoidia bacterium]
MKTEIIPVGTEILLGNIVDTDSSFLANQLSVLGIDLHYISTVGDNEGRLLDTLRRAWDRADIIIVTGGLGPTEDDITREAIARLVGEELTIDQRLWNALQRLLSRYPGGIPQSNIRQASVIPSAEVIQNRIGTAPGWWVEKGEHIIIALPGPPAEMKLMWEDSVLPRIREKAERATILSRTIKTFRLAEARVEELVAPLSRLSNPTLATYIHPDGVYLRITAKAATEEEARSIISNSEEQVRRALAAHIWGVDDDTLGCVVCALLNSRNLTLATMESSTDGVLCNAIADCAESPTCFAGGLLAGNHRAKAALGVDESIMGRHGEESPAVAEAMAEVARKRLRADLGLGVSCAMDSDSNSGDAFICLNGDGSSRVFSHRLRGDRARMRQRAVFAALFDL